MIKKSGKAYDYVLAELKARGVQGLADLGIATLGRGTDHLIVIGEDVVGAYNHKSKAVYLYTEYEYLYNAK